MLSCSRRYLGVPAEVDDPNRTNIIEFSWINQYIAQNQRLLMFFEIPMTALNAVHFGRFSQRPQHLGDRWPLGPESPLTPIAPSDTVPNHDA
jgi:hypothetical protein